MTIELRGVEFKNKGAELMLHSILRAVRDRFPDALFVMEHRGGSAPIKKQRSVGIYTKLNIKRFGMDTARLGLFVPKIVRTKLGFVHEKDIDVVLDASGFAFGDFWGARKAGERLADHIERWKAQGKKVILLSQAFGPFSDASLRKKMITVLTQADLVFARDKYSFAHLSSLQAGQERIRLRPDFTNLISGYVPAYFNGHQASGVAIIPNNKLLESNIFKDRDQYLQVLRKLVKLIGEAGGKPFFLIHEGEKDLRLAKDVSDGFPGPIDIIQEDDPLKVKGMIGASKAVITSRFHGLVSALSQAVPCLCIGWSHKYEALMEDYGYPDGLIGRDDLSGPGLKAKIEAVLRPESAETIRKQLSLAGQEQKKLARAMWDEVFEIING